jgi:hypothetical protein
MSTLDEEPIQFRGARPGNDPHTVVVTFEGKPEGVWREQLWDYTVDKARAELIQQYCNDRLARGQPIYREVIERDFGVASNN